MKHPLHNCKNKFDLNVDINEIENTNVLNNNNNNNNFKNTIRIC